MSHPPETARLRRWHVATAMVVVVAVVVVAAVLGAVSQKSKIDGLTTKNNTLTADKAQAMRQRDATQQRLDETQQTLDDRVAQKDADDAEAKRIEAMRPPGATLFAANCASCHGITGGGGIGLRLSGGTAARHLSEAQAVAFVSNGAFPPMPRFDALLSPAQVKQVVAYVLKL